MKDPELEGKGVSDGTVQSAFAAIPSSVFRDVSIWVEAIWTMERRRTTTAGAILESSLCWFSDKEMRTKDPLWKKHVASSLRELIDGQFVNHCVRVSCIPKRGSGDNERKLWDTYALHNNFLNEMTHLHEDTALDFAKQILERSDLTGVDDTVFEEVVTRFVRLLHSLFAPCMSKK